MTRDAAPGTARDPLLDAVRAAWERWDPPPADLADTVLVAIAMDDIDADYEFLTLVQRDAHLAGTRHDGVSDRILIELRSGTLTVLVRVSREPTGTRRLDGWVAPASGGLVTLVQDDRSVAAVIDANGRFDIPDARPGLTRLVVSPDAGPEAPLGEFRTTVFEI